MEDKNRKPLTKLQEQFLEILRNSAMNISVACEKTGISRRTFYYWKDNETFRELYEDAREELIDLAETKLMLQIKDGNIAAICFFLKTQAKHRGYVERQEYEDTTKQKFIDAMKKASELEEKEEND